VFANLLNNAAKYTDSGGRIGIKLETTPDAVVVRVADSGVGIDPAMQSSIFDMFVQVDQSLEKGRAGLGVGLTLAKQLIELHGGRITVRSAGLGRGSEFAVWLPRGDLVARAPATADAAGALASNSRHRILVADDNVDFATSLSHLLEGMGHEVTVTHDGASALEIAAILRPQFSFLDIGMPGLNGYELARRMRQHQDTRDSVLIAVTGWGQDKDRQRARASGFDHHLVKPIDVKQLQQVLNGGAQPGGAQPHAA
ncbi:MAG TPA: ATP-binding protein, partial [Albitalea sp.]|nr:ATP-binding protein [Albitalea sp.]